MPSGALFNEVVIDKHGQVRQAGASDAGHWIATLRDAAEKSLYVFGKAILGLTRLTTDLHLPTA
jgi:hypothetical protein